MPLDGTLPAHTWTSGQAFVEVRELRLPPDLPPGRYALRVDGTISSAATAGPWASGEEAFTLPLSLENRFPGGSGLP
ncbi:MAG: hypothetical protein HC915_21245 [Anaerolineae bacterium]|nr:hypothetical protein [Anaerolineae bacterium]